MAEHALTRSDVRLRPVEANDVDALWEMEIDHEGSLMAKIKPRSEETFRSIWENILRDSTVTPRLILVDGRTAGTINAFWRDDLHCIGYRIDKPYRGQGLLTAALPMFLLQVPSRPLHAFVASENTPSLRGLLRQGFEIVEKRFHEETERYMAGEVTKLRLM